MEGRERLIILGFLLTVIASYVGSLIIRYMAGALDFDSFNAEMKTMLAFVAGLLIKLPPTKAEAEATATAQASPTTEINVDAEQVDVKQQSGQPTL